MPRDFSEYKYKYFTGLIDGVASAASDGSKALESSAMYNAVCVKECPKDLPKSGLLNAFVNNPLAEKMDCMTNDDLPECPVAQYNTTLKYNYCLPDVDEEAAKEQFAGLYKQMNESLGIGQYVNDIKLAW